MLKTTKLLLLAAVLLFSVPALAAPITYAFQSGNIQIQAINDLTNDVVLDVTVDMTSNSFMVYDPTGTPAVFGTGTLDDFLFEMVPNQGPYGLSTPFGPYELVTLESASISPGIGYDTLVAFGTSLEAGPLLFDAFFGAEDTDGPFPTLTNQPGNVVPAQNLLSTITLGPSNITLSSNSLTMGMVDGDPFGEVADLRIDVNLFFAGVDVATIPEPGTGSLVALGLVGFGAARRVRRQR